MPEENDIVETVRENEIYKIWGMSLLSANDFAFGADNDTQNKFNLFAIQKNINILAGSANRYLLKRIGDGTDKKTTDEKDEANKLIERQKAFVKEKVPDKNDKAKYPILKKESLAIIDEYDQLLLKHNIFK